ncbi:MAG: transcription termination/antitermination protein NusG [Pirellulales bacterium]|nr:transcription termination/antitermination protein NusG [Pirellulales bacterium]
MSDEPNKLANELTAQPESPAAAQELPASGSEPGADLEAAFGAAPAASEEGVDLETKPDLTDERNVESGVATGDGPGDGPDDDNASGPGAQGGDASKSAEEPDDEIKMDWYILKVQSNREKSITAALKRKIAIEGLDEFFGDVVVPMEKVTEFKGGKKKIVERKLYPGYIVVHMHINDDTWFAVRETSGIGDFTGSGGKPTPMLPHEVARIIHTEEEVEEEAPKLNISFMLGDRVKVKEGTFESFEGEVSSIDQQSGRVTVMINIFGRSTPVELEYWQAEQL